MTERGNMTREEVRLDWNKALSKMDEEPIAGIIGWGFYLQDLLVLGDLHEHGLHQEYIEDLLEDCNFHHECALLSDGRYEEYRNFVFKECRI